VKELNTEVQAQRSVLVALCFELIFGHLLFFLGWKAFACLFLFPNFAFFKGMFV